MGMTGLALLLRAGEQHAKQRQIVAQRDERVEQVEGKDHAREHVEVTQATGQDQPLAREPCQRRNALSSSIHSCGR